MPDRSQPCREGIQRKPQKYKSRNDFSLRLLMTTTAYWRSGRDSNPATPGVTGRYSNQLNYHSSAG